jgi:3-oxoadipate enol-lactonase
VYYEIGGSGPRLLYISGTGGDLRGQPRVFDGPLPQSFEVLAYDQRGLGQTSKPDVAYSMADYADDAAALLDTVGWERCLVMGVSFGGMVAQELALRRAQRVERLVLCCTSSGGPGGASYPLHELQHLSVEERAVFQISITDKRKDAAWQAANPDAVKQAVEMALAGHQRREAEPGGQMGYRRQLEARAGHDTYDRLPSLRMPVFLAGGRYDGQAAGEHGGAARPHPGGSVGVLRGRARFYARGPAGAGADHGVSAGQARRVKAQAGQGVRSGLGWTERPVVQGIGGFPEGVLERVRHASGEEEARRAGRRQALNYVEEPGAELDWRQDDERGMTLDVDDREVLTR